MKTTNNIATPSSQAKQELINNNIPLIEIHNYGYVALKGYYGTDRKPADVARITSQMQTSKGFKALVRHLIRERHSTPIEFIQLEFEVALPLFVERQWIRHRTSTTNEVSGRYSTLPNETWELLEEYCVYGPQGNNNRQGSSDILLPDAIRKDLAYRYKKHAEESFELYNYAVDQGLTLERARTCLPLSTYTRKAWTVDLHNLFHFLMLRMDSHAQAEIREYAFAVAKLVQQTFPVLYEAFEDYRLNTISLSALDLKYLKDNCNLDLDGIIKHLEDSNKPDNFGKTEFIGLKQKIGKWKDLG